MAYTTLLFELRDDIALVTINRPDKLNALSDAVLDELDEVAARLQSERSIRAAILTGTGPKAFAAGADIAELAQCDADRALAFSRKGSSVFRRLERTPKPVLAAVNGFALGGGCELALACHVRIASDTARFGQPEVRLGIIPGYGGTVRLARLVGRGRAVELLLGGAPIDAQEAFRIGLVNRVVPGDRLLAESEQVLRTMLENGPVALSGCLEAVDRQEGRPLDEALALESELFGRLAGSQDFKEGTAAFLAKRKPGFLGR